jgi:HrpA-like RNA helicase
LSSLGKEAIINETFNNDTLVILGETGCGKTTQIPQYLIGPEYHRLLNNPTKPIKVVVTQPRRVAAMSLATRVSEEVGCRLGTTVGYTVRFDDCSEQKTRLKYVTDGTLLQEMLSDKLLSNYDIVIIDEAHERSLRTDMLLGFLKGIQRTRRTLAEECSDFPKNKSNQQASTPARPLKVIIMSATIDAERFSQFFDELSLISSFIHPSASPRLNPISSLQE